MERKLIGIVAVAVVIIVIVVFVAAIAGGILRIPGPGAAFGPAAGPGGPQPAGPGAFGGPGANVGPDATYGPGAGTGPGGASGYPVLLPISDTTPLSAQEVADILFIREEEQMTYDLYSQWAEMYPMPVFSNIRDAEAVHIYSVQLLMDRYDIPSDQIGNASAGYHNPVIQSWYDAFSSQGDTSQTDALEAGVAIEQEDIADLDAAIGHTSRPDILQVFGNLRQGSVNHESAFLHGLGR
jgi:hypothetical protein